MLSRSLRNVRFGSKAEMHRGKLLIAIPPFRDARPYFPGESKQRNPQEQRSDKKQNARAVDMMQAKKLAREKGCKQQRGAHTSAERQYDAVTQ